MGVRRWGNHKGCPYGFGGWRLAARRFLFVPLFHLGRSEKWIGAKGGDRILTFLMPDGVGGQGCLRHFG